MIKIIYTNDHEPNEGSAIKKLDTVNPKKDAEIIKIDHGTVSIKVAVEEQEFTSMDDSEENEAEKRVILTYYLHVESNFDSKSVTGKQPIAEKQEGELHVSVKNNILSITWNSGKEPMILIRTNIKKIADKISNNQGQKINPQSHWSPSTTIPYDENSTHISGSVSNHSNAKSSETNDSLTGDDRAAKNSFCSLT